MQALILAAGMGRRLGEYTKENTKCMLPVNGQRLIDRLLGQLGQLDLRRVVIVVGYKGDSLRRHIQQNYHGPLKIEFVENPVYDKTNNIYSLALASRQLQEDDTILIESDLIFSDKLFQFVAECPAANVALVAKYEPWMDGTMVRIDADCNIVSFVPKEDFDYQDVDNYYKTVNIYKFSREFSVSKYVPFLEAYCKALGNNAYYEQVLSVVSVIGQLNMKALPVGDEKWYEIDDAADLDVAETLFAEETQQVRKYGRRYGGYWRFPRLLDFCYLVNPYFPPKRMVEELKSSFENLLCQYPSGMEVNALLAGKYFGVKASNIVVGNGAAELIKALMEDETGRVGVVMPTFEEYPNRLAPGQVVTFTPVNADLRYGVDDLTAFFSDKQLSVLLLVNPDNPSGNFIQRNEVLRLARWCADKGIRLVVDESFVDFSEQGPANTLLDNETLDAYPSMVVMKSISKSYGVPGLRLGVMATANRDLIADMKHRVAIWNINSFAEYYMQIFGKYSSQYAKACRLFVKERERFACQLNSLPGLRVLPSEANFFLCELSGDISSTDLAGRLLSKYNILIKDCSTKHGLDGRQMIRLAVRNTSDNDALVAALKKELA